VIRKYNKHVYLDGFWQSEKYFLSIKDLIKESFSLDHFASDVDPVFLETIGNKNSISVHVRRGDYVSNNISNEFHGLCSMSYYENAFKYIHDNIRDPYFFVFSDDIEWCRKNLNLSSNDAFFVTNKGPQAAFKDLYMMTKCKHHIIANSSFSWWGAWLGKTTENEIVIAPEEWFNKKSRWYAQYLFSTKDMIPERWIRF
jgi:hypothetical protein